jgi:hypothetical protein
MLSLDSGRDEFKQIQIEKVHIDENVTDMLTNFVKRAKLDVCRRLRGMPAGRY